MTVAVPSKLAITVEIPEKLDFLFEPYRYKVVYGGRGKAQSWSFARALLVHAANSPLRILCTREVQKSIADSVHKLLSDQIALLGWQEMFEVYDNGIYGRRHGSEFIFSGLQDHTAASIKSFEGIDICWIEEAQRISKKSLDILIPTIRKEGSELWIGFNPELDTDEVYQRYVTTPPPNAKVVKLTYRDNPWFPETLELERAHAKATMNSEDYGNIWEGNCRTAVGGSIYAQEVMELTRQARITLVPYNPKMVVHTIWDMGWNDAMAIGLVQADAFSARLIGYVEGSYHKTADWCAQLNRLPYNWGWDWMPFDAYSGDRRSGQSDDVIARAMGRRVKPKDSGIPEIGVEPGIRATRELLGRLYIDQDGASAIKRYFSPDFQEGLKIGNARLLECLKRYKRHVPKHGNPGDPVHDEYSHGCDMLRHLAVGIERIIKESVPAAPSAPKLKRQRPLDALVGM